MQLVQLSLEQIEVRLVTPRPLTAAEKTALSNLIQESLGHPFCIKFIFCDEIERGRNGKYEEFRSEVAGD